MALVTSLMRLKQTTFRVHPTSVDCHFGVFDQGGRRYLQLNTYGSADRQDKGTVSQTLQFDESTARELRRVLADNFSG